MPTLLTAGILGLVVATAWATPFRLSSASARAAMTESPMAVLLMGALVVAGLAMSGEDRWLGIFVTITALNALRVHVPPAYETAQWTALGAGGLLAVRRWVDPVWARVVLVALAVSQILYAAGQWAGVDWLLENSSHGIPWRMNADPFIVGTLGNPNWLGALVAMTLPLAPVVLLPVFGIGLLLSQSVAALVAAVVGAWVRWPRCRGPILALGAGGLAVILLTRPYTLTNTVPARLQVWWAAVAAQSTFAPLWGSGPGSWFGQGFLHQREWWGQAHNEVVQLYFEGGVLALVCLGYWLAAHRRLNWRSPWTAAAAAVAVDSQAMFPFHLAHLAAPALVILGLATAEGSHA